MSIFQFLLTAGTLFIGGYGFWSIKLSAMKKIFFFVLIAATIYIIWFPDSTTHIANFLGIRRGVDMLFYCGFMSAIFICLQLYLRVRKLERNYSQLIRNQAVMFAEKIKGVDVVEPGIDPKKK